MRHLAYLPVALLVIGCGPATHEECVVIPTIDCDDTDGCALVRAEPMYELTDGVWCLRTVALGENLACRGVELDCDDERTLAEDSDGRQWRFADTCVPEGYTPLEGKAEPCGF